MKIYKVNKILQDKNMQNKDCNFKLTHPKGTSKFDLILDRLDKIDTRLDKLDSKIDKVEKSINLRIDNLVKKNDLKE